MLYCNSSTDERLPLWWRFCCRWYHQSRPWWHVQVRPGSMRPHCHDYTRLYITRAGHDDSFRFDQDQWGPIAMTTLAFISPEPAMMTCSGSTRINGAHCHDYTRLYITRVCHDDSFRFDQDQWGPIAMTTLAFISPESAMMTCSGSTRINGAHCHDYTRL